MDTYVFPTLSEAIADIDQEIEWFNLQMEHVAHWKQSYGPYFRPIAEELTKMRVHLNHMHKAVHTSRELGTPWMATYDNHKVEYEVAKENFLLMMEGVG